MLGRPEYRGYFIASIGALIAVLAFFILPFGSIDYNLGEIQRSITIKTSDFTTAGSWFTLPLGIIWLSILLLLAVIGTAIVILVQGSKSNQIDARTSRWAGETITTLGALSLILFLWTYFLVMLRVKDVYPAQMQATVNPSFGAILFIIFALIAIGGGIVVMATKRIARKRATGQLLMDNKAQP